jgi:hypothetical protein
MITDFYGFFGDVRCIAEKTLPQVRGNSAPAKLGDLMSVLSASYQFMHDAAKVWSTIN